MLAPIGRVAALAGIALLALAGCTQPEPVETTGVVETPGASVVDDATARALFNRYWDTVVASAASGDRSDAPYTEFTTQSVAQEAASSVATSLDTDVIPTSRPTVTLLERLASDASTTTFAVCTDVASLQLTTTAGDPVAAPATPTEVQWDYAVSIGEAPQITELAASDLNEASRCG